MKIKIMLPIGANVELTYLSNDGILHFETFTTGIIITNYGERQFELISY